MAAPPAPPDPPESVARIQQALTDLGFPTAVDGVYGPNTDARVTQYKTARGIFPNDGVVGVQTMTHLDEECMHELMDAASAALAGGTFDPGPRTGTRAELSDVVASCDFTAGVMVEIARSAAYFVPREVANTWAAGGGVAAFGPPAAAPFAVAAGWVAQEFVDWVFLAGPGAVFPVPRAAFEAFLLGQSFLGDPTGPPVPAGAGVALPFTAGSVLLDPESVPVPLPRAVFDLWQARSTSAAPLGPPVGFAYPTPAGAMFPFRAANVEWDGGAGAMPTAAGPSLNWYFTPASAALRLHAPAASSAARPLFGGTAALAAMRADIEAATGPGDFVFLANWNCEIDLRLPDATGAFTRSLGELLADPARAGVQVRALFWAGRVRGIPPLLSPQTGVFATVVVNAMALNVRKVNNEAAAVFINAFAPSRDYKAILDGRHLDFGSHHQKILVVQAGGRLTAYVGGIEYTGDRLSSVPNPRGSPLFDVSVRLEGPAAIEVYNTFADRWTATVPGDVLRIPAATVPVANPLTVQLTHTYGRGCPFPVSVRTAAFALAKALLAARQYFYMECQYFVGNEMLGTAIRSALTNNPGLTGIVVIAAEDCVGDLPDLPFRRREFLRPLQLAFPGRLLVFERLGGGTTTGPGAYVHSKLLLVDDEALLVGSVNASRRSWFHDSEVCAVIVDVVNGPGGTAPGTRGWVRDFRCELWARHFPGIAPMPGDPAAAIALWRNIDPATLAPVGSTVRQYDAMMAAVPRYSPLGVRFTPAALAAVWDAVEDPK
ncbi:MAG: peptidoglycan-binding protein [Isosphaeraceae bacterium]